MPSNDRAAKTARLNILFSSCYTKTGLSGMAFDLVPLHKDVPCLSSYFVLQKTEMALHSKSYGWEANSFADVGVFFAWLGWG